MEDAFDVGKKWESDEETRERSVDAERGSQK